MCDRVIKAGNRKGTSGPDKMPSSWSNNHNSKNARVDTEWFVFITCTAVKLCVASG